MPFFYSLHSSWTVPKTLHLSLLNVSRTLTYLINVPSPPLSTHHRIPSLLSVPRTRRAPHQYTLPASLSFVWRPR